MNTWRVKAARPDVPVWVEGKTLQHQGQPGSLITADEPVEVPNTRYYRRRLEAGDLVLVEESPKKAKKE